MTTETKCDDKCGCKVGRASLKNLFQEGRTPSQKDFSLLIDAMVNQREDEICISGPENRVGIGLSDAQSRLAVCGNLAVGCAVAGKEAAPENGLLIQGGLRIQALSGEGVRMIAVDKEGMVTVQNAPAKGVQMIAAGPGLSVEAKSSDKVKLDLQVGNGLQLRKAQLEWGGELSRDTEIKLDQHHFLLSSGNLPAAQVDGLGNLQVRGGIDLDPGRNHAIKLGTMQLLQGKAGSLMGLSHTIYSHRDSVALSQSANGTTIIQAAPGRDLELRIGGDTKVKIHASGRMEIGTEGQIQESLLVHGQIMATEGFRTNQSEFAVFFESQSGEAIPVGTPVVIDMEGKVRPFKIKAKATIEKGTATKGKEAKEALDELPKAGEPLELMVGVVTHTPAVQGNAYHDWPEKYTINADGKPNFNQVSEPIQESKIEPETAERLVINQQQAEGMPEETIAYNAQKKRYEQSISTPKKLIENANIIEVEVYNSNGDLLEGKYQVAETEVVERNIQAIKGDEIVRVNTSQKRTYGLKEQNQKFVSKGRKAVYVPRDREAHWNSVALMGVVAVLKTYPTHPNWVLVRSLSTEFNLYLIR